MSIVLIVLGLLLALAGLAAIVAGGPEWLLGLNLGSALIQSGAIGLVGGLILVGIGLLLRAVRDLVNRIDAWTSAAAEYPIEAAAAPAPEPKVTPPPEVEPAPAQPAARQQPAREPRAEAPAPSAKEAGQPFAAETKGPRPRAWPPQTSPSARLAPAEPVAAPATTPAQVLRSGIIGGMAYTLYSDGSIEAELPVGTMRFASLEELREHVARTGTQADVEFGGPAQKPQ